MKLQFHEKNINEYMFVYIITILMVLTYLYLTIYLLHEAFEPIIKEIYRIRKLGTAQV